MKYNVTVPYAVFVTVKGIEADSEEEAIEKAFDDGEVGLSSYVGNGGSDKLIGVSDSNCSVEAGESPIDGIGPFAIEATAQE